MRSKGLLSPKHEFCTHGIIHPTVLIETIFFKEIYVRDPGNGPTLSLNGLLGLRDDARQLDRPHDIQLSQLPADLVADLLRTLFLAMLYLDFEKQMRADQVDTPTSHFR